MTSDAQRQQIDRNYDFLQRNLAMLLPRHSGQYALIRDCQFLGFFDSPGEAFDSGLKRFSDRIFSIQEVTSEPLDLGFFSHAAG